MRTTKLTLSADRSLVRRAKKYAASRKTSLSATVSRLLNALVQKGGRNQPLPPLTRRASGLAGRLPNRKAGDLLADALDEG